MFVSNVQTFWKSKTTEKGENILIFPLEMILFNDGVLKCKETCWERKINIVTIT